MKPLFLASVALGSSLVAQTQLSGDTVGDLPPSPFGGPAHLDSAATGKWWNRIGELKRKRLRDFVDALELTKDRPQSVAFALYTHENKTLKLNAQLYPQRPGAPTAVRLEFQRDGKWQEAARTRIVYPGWSALFRIENWDSSKTVPYRVRHGEKGLFMGSIRKDPKDKQKITVAVMSCNGTHNPKQNPHLQTIANLKKLDPDLLFFAGDQHYQHTQHTAGWLAFGLAFAEVTKDRPTVTIPDDHDVGHANLWGEAGGVAKHGGGADGGYLFPGAYVNMVQRQQTWHLPDPVDPAPVKQGITVYFTRLRIGGVDFAILEDRKFKTGPMGTIPKMGPRPDHINDASYDPRTVDLPGLKLLGDRQLAFLRSWSQDWRGAQMKAALSQTAFCGAVHIHGQPTNYLLADLDCNGWPQTGRNKALSILQQCRAVHLCGDQHLAAVVKHGIHGADDGPYAFTSPALFNSIYGRWWKPKDGRPGTNPVKGSPLPYTGNFTDGLGNPIRMLAYANPSLKRRRPMRERAAGIGVARFDKAGHTVTFECWSRFAEVGVDEQFKGWPITVPVEGNDTREEAGQLPIFTFDIENPVIQVRRARDGKVVYTRRIRGNAIHPSVFAKGVYEVLAGRDAPTQVIYQGPARDDPGQPIEVILGQ